MGLKFRPVDGLFYDLLEQSADHLVVGAQLLAEMLNDESDRTHIAERMRAAEHAADETTHALIRLTGQARVTPFAKEDTYALASRLDDVMDIMDEVVDLILLYRITELPPGLSSQVEVLQHCAEVTSSAMKDLRQRKELSEHWIEINRLENVGDQCYRENLAHLFSGGHDLLEVIKLKDVVGALESAVDAFESVAHLVERVMLTRPTTR